MNYLGIYFGLKDICIVETKGRKIVNNILLPQTNIAFGEIEDKVPADVKLIALLKDAFRTYRVNTKEAIFCISGQDLIIRTFEIPQIPQKELKSAINFEAKKYIPFKLEELIYDFQVLSNNKNKTILVLFVGIKKETLDNYASIASQLDLKVGSIEYSAFSILRFLKVAGVRESGILGSLCFDLKNEDEVNFTVFENGFPLFSRDIILMGGPAGFEQTEEADFAEKQEKLKNEIRVSIDYCHRRFPEKKIRNIFVVSDSESRQELQSFLLENTIPAKFIDTQKVIGKDIPYSSMLTKGFAASLFKGPLLKIKINLFAQKLKASTGGGARQFDLSYLLEGFKPDLRIVLLGVSICFLVFMHGLMKARPIQDEIRDILSRRAKVVSVSGESDYETLLNVGAKYKKKLKTIDALIRSQLYATYPLSAIPESMPPGAWLTKLSFNRKDAGSSELVLEGQVYLGDSAKEFEAVDKLLSNLKNNVAFSEHFKDIKIKSIDRKTVMDRSVAEFSIVCRENPESQ